MKFVFEKRMHKCEAKNHGFVTVHHSECKLNTMLEDCKNHLPFSKCNASNESFTQSSVPTTISPPGAISTVGNLQNQLPAQMCVCDVGYYYNINEKLCKPGICFSSSCSLT
jgi:hypothetical protein